MQLAGQAEPHLDTCVRVPTRVARVEADAPGERSLWCHLRVNSANSRRGTVTVDLGLMAESGEIGLALVGLELRPLERGRLAVASVPGVYELDVVESDASRASWSLSSLTTSEMNSGLPSVWA